MRSRSQVDNCFLPCGMRMSGDTPQSSSRIRLLASGSCLMVSVPLVCPEMGKPIPELPTEFFVPLQAGRGDAAGCRRKDSRATYVNSAVRRLGGEYRWHRLRSIRRRCSYRCRQRCGNNGIGAVVGWILDVRNRQRAGSWNLDVHRNLRLLFLGVTVTRTHPAAAQR